MQKQLEEQRKEDRKCCEEDRKRYEEKIRELRAELGVCRGNGSCAGGVMVPAPDERRHNNLPLEAATQQWVQSMVETVKTRSVDELRRHQGTDSQKNKRRREESVTPCSQQQTSVTPGVPSTFGSPLEGSHATPRLSPQAKATVEEHADIHDERSGFYSIYFKAHVNDENVAEVLKALPLARPDLLPLLTFISATGSIVAASYPSSSVTPPTGRDGFSGSTLHLASRFKALSGLSITYQTISDAGATAIGKLTSLKTLELSKCVNVNSNTLSQMLPGLTLLEHLDLSKTRVKEAGMKIVGQHLCGNLKSLNVSSCDDLTDAAFKHLSSCKRLEKLEAKNLLQLSDAGLLHLAKLPLKDVTLESSSNITGAWLQKLDSEEIGCLESLDLSYTKVSDDVLKHLAAHATGLTKLWIRLCPNVTQHGLMALFKAGRGLEVSCKGCNVPDVLGKFRRSSLANR
ncbi:hypothetical protein CLOM_g7327 [Closterium sp. NIES-68]|nr:hypothetical protein CLOM_g7327 [Closterium sp. NIES-68]GJP62622.1 hypothetical protein CLOP_g19660 [Closterium sp. NIES-67]